MKNFENESDPLAAVVNYWLKGNTDVPISWRALVEALKAKSVGEPGLAEQIRKKHRQHADAKEG